MRAIVVLTLVGALVASARSGVGAESAMQAYQRALAHVCQRQVTPELIRLYQAARRELEASGRGFGRDSNFSGLRDPYLAYNDCFQAPGFR